jgi:hypothetical protein
MISDSVALKNSRLDQIETFIGAAPVVRLYNGVIPANADTALSGNTLVAQGTPPSDWMANAAGGVKTKTGTWTLTGQAGAGTGTPATFYRIFDPTGTTCHRQGSVGAAFNLATNALTAANGNVLNFASTAGVAIGQAVSGAGIPVGAVVLAFTGTTVTISVTSSAGVANAASITFGYDMNLDNNNIANAQSINVASYQWTAGN